ncbi:PAS domain-containing sensor histidine kinase [Pedobacter sp. P351]|uniref:PAS domain-containing sensor histidine kinase n=1 Tax=Pedobacter superstes TaxID=3133441 RepID=UPI003098737C
MMNDVNRSKDILNFELFFEVSTDLLCIAGFDGYFKRINPAVSKLLGYSNEELYAKPISEFIYFKDRHITGEHRKNLLKDTPLTNFENRYVTKSGEIIWLAWTSIPVYEHQVVYAIAKNITHKKKLEEDRNQVIENLTTVNNDLKLLTYSTSHDLRTPVNNLLAVFDLLDISKIEDEETLDFIDILKLATESLKDTLNNYVDILNQKNELKIQTQEVFLNDSLNSVRQSLNSLLHTSKASISADFSEVEVVNFNKAYLESIFLNLITNSIKYARPGYSPVISIHSKWVNGCRELIYMDEGQGFDMEKLKDKIFGLNQKFHNHSDSKGIGLYLVYNHIKSLGGKISIESRINEGAKFTITFKD